MSEYRFEKITDDNIPSLHSLAKDAFGVDFPSDYFQKKFATTWCGIKNTGYIALDESGRAVGYYGMYPCIIHDQGQDFLSAQVGDTMTHSKHRGKGLFKILATKTYALGKELGVKFVYGFPNEEAYPGVVTKLNWTQKEFMNLYKIKIPSIPLAKLAFKFKFLDLLYFRFIKFFLRNKLSNKASFKNSNIDAINGGLLRNDAYFNYKKGANKFLIEIFGVCVWIKVDGFLFVGDIERADETSYDKSIQKLMAIAKWIGVTEIIFQASPGSFMDKMLMQNYPPHQGARIGYLSFDDKIDGRNLKFTIADFDTF